MKKNIFFLLMLVTSINYAADTILLTGGAGFIGSHTAIALLQRDYRVIIVDNLNDYYDPALKRAHLARIQTYDPTGEKLCFYEVDICDKNALAAVWQKEKPSLVCHLAAYAGVPVSVSNPGPYLNTNILGMLNLLELAKEYPVKNFVFASSSSVYGNTARAPFQESESADMPCSPYAMSKRASEMLAYTYHHLHNIPCTGLRFFTVYGPYGRTDMAPFMFMQKIYNDQPIQVFGDANIRMRDFTYVDDIVDGIIKAIEKPHNFEIFNLGRGNPVTLQEFISTIERIVQKKAIIIKKRVPAGDVDATYADISKAERMLNYHPTVSLEEGMQRMFTWYMNEYHAQGTR